MPINDGFLPPNPWDKWWGVSGSGNAAGMRIFDGYMRQIQDAKSKAEEDERLRQVQEQINAVWHNICQKCGRCRCCGGKG